MLYEHQVSSLLHIRAQVWSQLEQHKLSEGLDISCGPQQGVSMCIIIHAIITWKFYWYESCWLVIASAVEHTAQPEEADAKADEEAPKEQRKSESQMQGENVSASETLIVGSYTRMPNFNPSQLPNQQCSHRALQVRPCLRALRIGSVVGHVCFQGIYDVLIWCPEKSPADLSLHVQWVAPPLSSRIWLVCNLSHDLASLESLRMWGWNTCLTEHSIRCSISAGGNPADFLLHVQ